MTEEEEQVVEFYRLFKAKHHYAPTIREVAEQLDIGVATALGIVQGTPGMKRRKISKGRYRWQLDDSIGT